MAVFPLTPTPSSISAATLIDPHHQFVSDQGYEMRRAMHSRPRRRWRLDYLGKSSAEMHVFQDFFQQQRLGALPFEWLHSKASDQVHCTNSTPVWCILQHNYVSGQWVWINNSIPNTSLNGFWTITRIDAVTFSLNGSTAGGDGTCNVVTYVPNAVGRFADGEMEAAQKLIGPEVASPYGQRGKWSFAVLIEELF